jgi:hypothetical protein
MRALSVAVCVYSAKVVARSLLASETGSVICKMSPVGEALVGEYAESQNLTAVRAVGFGATNVEI